MFHVRFAIYKQANNIVAALKASKRQSCVTIRLDLKLKKNRINTR